MKRLAFLLVFIAGFSLFAEETATCETDLGKCEFTKNSMVCECAEGTYGEGGGMASISPEGGEMPLPTTEECEAEIKEQCDLPEGAEQCNNPAGKCVVFEDGSYHCDCLDGSGEGSSGTSGGSTGDDDTPTVDPDDGNVDGEVDGETEIDPVEDEPVEPQEECETNADCGEGAACIDGFCNFVGEKLVCADKLVEVCGTKAPQLSDHCSADALVYCVDLFNLYSDKCNDTTMSDTEKKELLDGTWNEYGSEIADCCEESEETDAKKKMEAMRDCLKAKSCEDCVEQVEPVYGDDDDISGGDSADSSTDEEGGIDQGDTADDAVEKQQVSDGGCSALIL